MKLTKLTKTNKMFLALFVLLPMFILIGCSKDDNGPGLIDPPPGGGDGDGGLASIVLIVEPDPGDTPDAVLVPNSKNVSNLGLEGPLVITFSEGKVPTTTGGTNASSEIVGNNVSIVLSGNNANVVLQGVSSSGSVSISGNYDFNLYLNGVGITNLTGAAVINKDNGTMNVTVVDGTSNRLIDGAESSDKAAFYSNGDFLISGVGSLEVRGKVSHAIASKNSYKQSNGNIWAKSAIKDGVNASSIEISGGSFKSRTIGDGLQGDDFLTVTGGEFDIITTSDDQKANGLKSDGDILISGSPKLKVIVYGTASKSISSDGNLTINGGDFTLQTAGNGFWDESEQADDKTSSSAAIKCDGDLLIRDGIFNILSAGTGGKGISVDGNITIDGGTFKIATTGKTYYSDIYSQTSGAIKTDKDMTINGGKFYIKTFTHASEGIECEINLTINDGHFEIEAYDDAINVSSGGTNAGGKDGILIINGGTIYCSSNNNDGIDCNGTITVNGGIIVSLGTAAPEGSFDCDNNIFTIKGGTLIGISGGTNSEPSSSTSTNCSIECDNVTYSDIYYIESTNTDNVKEIITFKLPRVYQHKLCMLFSSGKFVENKDYTLYSGGSISGGTDFHGLYTGATYTKGTPIVTFTAAKNTRINIE